LNYDWEGIPMVSHFTYNFQRYERVGIVGTNGVGKSTFLNLLAYSDLPSIERGASIKIGYYRQEGMSFNEEDTVLDVVPDTRLLGKFLFPHDMFANKIAKLSGGERRRLYLLTVLMQEPNVLILDEPTNDLDIVTLNVLEEYLLEFKGTLIIVTHDRHFLDRLVDHLLVFCGDGKIKDFVGGYSEYRCFIEDLRAEQRQKEKELSRKSAVSERNVPQTKKKLTYKERLELEALERTLDDLNAEKSEIEQRLSSGTAAYDEIAQLSARYAQIKEELELAELRWLELSC
jgi:ATP-binding cassette subfamily F protein uup